MQRPFAYRHRLRAQTDDPWNRSRLLQRRWGTRFHHGCFAARLAPRVTCVARAQEYRRQSESMAAARRPCWPRWRDGAQGSVRHWLRRKARLQPAWAARTTDLSQRDVGCGLACTRTVLSIALLRLVLHWTHCFPSSGDLADEAEALLPKRAAAGCCRLVLASRGCPSGGLHWSESGCGGAPKR